MRSALTRVLPVAALLLGLAAGYALWGRPLQRAETRLHALRAIARPPAPSTFAGRRPDAILDLGTEAGAALARAEWRSRVVDIDRAPPPPPGASDSDASWDLLAPTALEGRRPAARWYRTSVTVPERVAQLDTAGTSVVLEVAVDGYVEVWVNGALRRAAGPSGLPAAAGSHATARVVLTQDARPGESFQVAVLTVNGPIEGPVSPGVAVRSATLDFYRAEARPPAGEIVRLDPTLDAIVPPGAQVDKIADRLLVAEGPVWMTGGYLLFSDVGANMIYRWSPVDGLSVFRTKSGHVGSDIGTLRHPGSNGLAVDREGRLTIAEHGRRRVVRVEPDGGVTVLADRFEGRRLNSPNDLVYRSDGSLYFTDPPFGLPGGQADPQRELPFSGIFRWDGGRLELLDSRLRGPNGLAFGPDERHLYVANWDADESVVMRYEVRPDGTLGDRRVFVRSGGDGIAVDGRGNVYLAAHPDAWILSPDGKHLGTIRVPEPVTNFAWGDEDRRTLYITAARAVYRVRLGVPGAGAGSSAGSGAPPGR